MLGYWIGHEGWQCLEWLNKASLQIEKIAELSGIAALGPHHFAGILARSMNADQWKVSRKLEKTSPQTPYLKIAELQGAAAPWPYHFAMILIRGVKADTCLEWLEMASRQTSNFKKSLSLPHHFVRVLDVGTKTYRCLEWLEKPLPILHIWKK